MCHVITRERWKRSKEAIMGPTAESRDPGLRAHAIPTLLSLALLGLALAALALPSSGTGAAAAVPRNTGEPRVSGRAEQGRTLSATRGTWEGSGISYAYRWVRCGVGGGLPDGSDCISISGATGANYVLTAADVGFRMRVRVTASNSDGSRTAASNPTAIVVGPPVLVSTPSVRGSVLVGSVLTADPGRWTGRQPITFSYRWLRCNSQGGECAAIAGATGRTYRVTSADVGRKIRFNITARNAIASVTVISGESAVGAEPLPAGAVRLPSGEYSIPATSVSSNHRLVVTEVRFSPNRVTNRRQTIAVQIRVKDSRGFVVRDAFVFIRSTPKVTTGGDRRLTSADGWLGYELVPTSSFPTKAKTAVQFFVKAYRSGDPPLGGVYGSRLVQIPVRLAR
jgi:hypothetical protein